MTITNLCEGSYQANADDDTIVKITYYEYHQWMFIAVINENTMWATLWNLIANVATGETAAPSLPFFIWCDITS